MPSRARASDWMHTASDDEDAIVEHGYSSEEDQRTQISRPSKRRRLSETETEDEDDENISDEEEVERPVNKRRKRRTQTNEELSGKEDESDEEEYQDEEDEDGDEDEAERSLPAIATIPLRKTKPTAASAALDITDPNQMTGQTPTQALASRSLLKKTGVCYLSRIPPYMVPSQIRHLLTPFGTINRIFLSPELPSTYQKRIKSGGNKKRQFVEGWVEFERKKAAKWCAESLNAQQVGGRKGGWWYDDVWNILYLKNFKWSDLTQQIANENAARQSRVRAEVSQTTRENKNYIRDFERSKMIGNMQAAAKDKKLKSRDGNTDKTDPLTYTAEEKGEPRRTFDQRASGIKTVKGVKKRAAGGEKSEAMKKLLSSVF
ncbi:hypothetical protein ABW21_db0207133 [Orbilia brochopaga]|nr:hypothetical protein ABW21_db0207133 [Drechslerella brochopaga]